MIVALVGMPSSGKGEASEIFKKKGFTIVKMRDAVLKELEARGLKTNPENVGMVANELRNLEGPASVAKRTLPAVLEAGEKVCIEGVRSKAEVDFFRESLGDFVCVGVDAPAEKRYAWAVERGREDDVKSLEGFQKKEDRESGWGIREAVDGADYKITNDGTLEEFQDKILELLEKILKEKILKGDEI